MTNRSLWQSIDLGIHTEPCMTRPETCGEAGGAVSLWVNVLDCPAYGGILTTVNNGHEIGFRILCDINVMGYVKYKWKELKGTEKST